MTDLNRGKTPDNFTYLNPADFAKLFAPDLPLEQAQSSRAMENKGTAPTLRNSIPLLMKVFAGT